MKKILKDSCVLLVITLVAGLLLGLVYSITKDPIATQKEKAQQEAYKKVFSTADHFTALTDDNYSDGKVADTLKPILSEAGYDKDEINGVVVAYDAAGKSLGLVLTTTAKDGYGGDIQFTVGIKEDGTVNGISMLSINETAGLGMRAKDAAFTDKFANKQVEEFKVTKTGSTSDSEIDALSGSTITSKAVTNGVNSAIVAFNYIYNNVVNGGAK